MNEMYYIEPEIKSKISEYSGNCIIESITVELFPVNYNFRINKQNKDEINWNIKNKLVDILAKQIIDDLIPLDVTQDIHMGINTIYSLNILQEKERVEFIKEIKRLKDEKEDALLEKSMAEYKLERINDLGFWKTIKMAFKKLRSKK